jgi:hypothetical protein
MRAGRKRKAGRRYASGDRVKAVRQDEVRRVALEARMRLFGISGETAARDAMGSPLGRLMHWNMISPAQADAGYGFACAMRDYLAAIGSRPTSQSQARFLSPNRGACAPDMPAEVEARAKACMQALREVDLIDPLSPSTTSIVWDVCVSENDRLGHRELGLLRTGLNALNRLSRRGLVAGRKAKAG